MTAWAGPGWWPPLCQRAPVLPPVAVLQEQYKCVYDTLEEYTVCGTSFFYVHQLSQRLKQKSLKERSSKKQQNEYEKEYSVSLNCLPAVMSTYNLISMHPIYLGLGFRCIGFVHAFSTFNALYLNLFSFLFL